jgi:hypothetical protein
MRGPGAFPAFVLAALATLLLARPLANAASAKGAGTAGKPVAAPQATASGERPAIAPQAPAAGERSAAAPPGPGPSAPAANGKAVPSDPAAACGEALSALPAGMPDPPAFLDAAACLRRADSSAAGSRMPFERFLAERAPSPSDKRMRAKLPAGEGWIPGWLARARARRDPARAPDAAWLAEACLVADGLPGSPSEGEAWRELVSLYLSIPDPFHAGLGLLRQVEIDSVQAGMAQYQLGAAVRQPGAEASAQGLLDSLAAAYRHRIPRTAEMLESLAWGERAYAAAFRSFRAWKALGDPGPGVALDRVNRFQSLGYFDYAAAILDDMDWRKLPPPWRAQARSAALRIRFQLQDWPGVLAEAGGADVTGKLPQQEYAGEEACFVAAALLKLGRAEEALVLARDRAAKAPSPWGFRARLLAAQAQMALARPQEAARTLDALKRDPKRQEGTGPILFWQACLALDQGRFGAADSLLVLASAYTGTEEAQRALDYRFFLILDTAAAARGPFFHGLPEAPRPAAERRANLDRVPGASDLWPFAQLEKAQILLSLSEPDSALAVFDAVAKRSPMRLAGYEAEARAAFLEEKLPGGRQAALARYEDLLIKYQRGVIPEFSRGRIRALR